MSPPTQHDSQRLASKVPLYELQYSINLILQAHSYIHVSTRVTDSDLKMLILHQQPAEAPHAWYTNFKFQTERQSSISKSILIYFRPRNNPVRIFLNGSATNSPESLFIHVDIIL